MTTPTQMPESLKVPEELAAIQQALDAGPTPGPWTAVVQADWPHPQDVYITAERWGAVTRARIDPSLPNVAIQRANLRLLAASSPATWTAVLSHISALQSALNDRDAEIERLKKDAERLEFMCSKAPLRFIEGNDDMWRVYQDEAPPEACAHKWRAIVVMYHPTAREAIDAAIDSMKGDANGL